MSDVSEMMLDGDCCQECGVYIGDGDGFPRSCRDCRRSKPATVSVTTNAKAPCWLCGKKLVAVPQAIEAHYKAKHP